MSAGVKGGSAPERGHWCGWNEGSSWLLLSPRSRSPGAAEGGSARAEQRGRGDVSRLMATQPLPAEGAGQEVSDTVCVCTSIFASIRGFFGNLQNRTRASHTLNGGRHVPTNFPGRQSETPWNNAPATMSAQCRWLSSTHRTLLLGPRHVLANQ